MSSPLKNEDVIKLTSASSQKELAEKVIPPKIPKKQITQTNINLPKIEIQKVGTQQTIPQQFPTTLVNPEPIQQPEEDIISYEEGAKLGLTPIEEPKEDIISYEEGAKLGLTPIEEEPTDNIIPYEEASKLELKPIEEEPKQETYDEFIERQSKNTEGVQPKYLELYRKSTNLENLVTQEQDPTKKEELQKQLDVLKNDRDAYREAYVRNYIRNQRSDEGKSFKEKLIDLGPTTGSVIWETGKAIPSVAGQIGAGVQQVTSNQMTMQDYLINKATNAVGLGETGANAVKKVLSAMPGAGLLEAIRGIKESFGGKEGPATEEEANKAAQETIAAIQSNVQYFGEELPKSGARALDRNIRRLTGTLTDEKLREMALDKLSDIENRENILMGRETAFIPSGERLVLDPERIGSQATILDPTLPAEIMSGAGAVRRGVRAATTARRAATAVGEGVEEALKPKVGPIRKGVGTAVSKTGEMLEKVGGSGLWKDILVGSLVMNVATGQMDLASGAIYGLGKRFLVGKGGTLLRRKGEDILEGRPGVFGGGAKGAAQAGLVYGAGLNAPLLAEAETPQEAAGYIAGPAALGLIGGAGQAIIERRAMPRTKVTAESVAKSKPATKRQKTVMSEFGIPFDDKTTVGEAADKINKFNTGRPTKTKPTEGEATPPPTEGEATPPPVPQEATPTPVPTEQTPRVITRMQGRGTNPSIRVDFADETSASAYDVGSASSKSYEAKMKQEGKKAGGTRGFDQRQRYEQSRKDFAKQLYDEGLFEPTKKNKGNEIYTGINLIDGYKRYITDLSKTAEGANLVVPSLREYILSQKSENWVPGKALVEQGQPATRTTTESPVDVMTEAQRRERAQQILAEARTQEIPPQRQVVREGETTTPEPATPQTATPEPSIVEQAQKPKTMDELYESLRPRLQKFQEEQARVKTEREATEDPVRKLIRLSGEVSREAQKMSEPKRLAELRRKQQGEAGFVIVPDWEDIKQAGINLYDGVKTFAEWSGEMVSRFGTAIKDSLKEVWDNLTSIYDRIVKDEAGAVGDISPITKKIEQTPTEGAIPVEENIITETTPTIEETITGKKQNISPKPLDEAKKLVTPEQKKLIIEAEKRIKSIAKDNPEATRLELVYDKTTGLPKFAENENGQIDVVYKSEDYKLRKAPNLPKDEIKAISKAADKLESEAKVALGDKTNLSAIGWYQRMRRFLQERFGANIELFGQLLGATSANTPVADNFKQTLEAARLYSQGKYDGLLERYDAHIQKVKQDLDSGKLLEDWQEKNSKKKNPQKLSEYNELDEYRKAINSFSEVPLKENGSKFNINSGKVLQALYGNWLTQTKGPKTPNFAGNLTGRTLDATIDVWAARMLRRLLYSDNTKKWRILPEQESGVKYNISKSGEYGGDFTFAQKVFAEAAKRLNMAPDDLQALLWYHEKGIWDKNGWTGTIGGEKSSFDTEAAKLNTERYQAGLTTYTNPIDFSKKDFYTELDNVRKKIGEVKDLTISRVVESDGLYGGEVEPTFDIEWTNKVGANVNSAINEILRVAKDNNQKDVIISKVVNKEHPNARPMVEIGFKKPATPDEINKVTGAFMDKGIDGFTVAKDRSGNVIGIRAQYVPEISARFDEANRLTILSNNGYINNSKSWVKNMQDALNDVKGIENVSYGQEGYVSTIVYGNEEYSNPVSSDFDIDIDSNLSRRLGIFPNIEQNIQEVVQ